MQRKSRRHDCFLGIVDDSDGVVTSTTATINQGEALIREHRHQSRLSSGQAYRPGEFIVERINHFDDGCRPKTRGPQRIGHEGAQLQSRGVPIVGAGVGVVCARNQEQCSKQDENRRGLLFQTGDSETHEGWRVRCKEVDYNRAEVVVFGVGAWRLHLHFALAGAVDAKPAVILYSRMKMSADLLARLKTSPVLCDGAMGTLLYSKGIFINRCYDELNLSQPDLIRGVHREYLQAGAEIVETNTFGGNSFRLERHGLGGKVHDINFAGARLAKEAAKSFDAWVAGSVGPLGIRIEPLGKTSFQEARDAFREQIAALLEGGVDILILETFGYVEELHQALLAARELNPRVPVIAQVTVDEEANCLDGSTPETFAPRLEQWGADVMGCNCSVGPVAMLDAIERVRAATSLPVSAQPNAGIPRSVEGRNIYLCSPEYMASYTRKFVAAGVKLVGGCCGTTPAHIRVMKSGLRATQARPKLSDRQVKSKVKLPAAIEAVPLAQRSRLGAKIAGVAFVTMVEIVPPKGTSIQK